MTLGEFNQIYAPAIQAVASVIALIGIALLGYQIWQSISWNRANAVLQIVEVDRFHDLEEKAIAACKAINVKFPVVLTADEARQIRTNAEAYRAVKALATILDRHAIAYDASYFDKKIYAATFGPWLVGYRAYLNAYIEDCRTETNCHEEYAALVAVATLIGEQSAQRRGPISFKRQRHETRVASREDLDATRSESH